MADQPRPHALGQLIRDVQQANGWSYADISANAGRAGRGLSRSRVESLRNDPLTSIGIKAIEALAAGLDVTPERVVAAAIDAMGYPPTSDDSSPSTIAAVQSDPMLSAATRRVLLAAVEAAHAEYDRPSELPQSPRSKSSPRRRRVGGERVEDVAADDD